MVALVGGSTAPPNIKLTEDPQPHAGDTQTVAEKNPSSTRDEKGGKAAEASQQREEIDGGWEWKMKGGLEQKCEENEKVEVAPWSLSSFPEQLQSNSDTCRLQEELHAAHARPLPFFISILELIKCVRDVNKAADEGFKAHRTSC